VAKILKKKAVHCGTNIILPVYYTKSGTEL